LGLSISREITRLLGGRIRVESEQSVGSVFTLFIPAEFMGEVETFDGTLSHDSMSTSPSNGFNGGGEGYGLTTSSVAAAPRLENLENLGIKPRGYTGTAISNAVSSVAMPPSPPPALAPIALAPNPDVSPTAAALKTQALASHRDAIGSNVVEDDRDDLRPGDRKLLIVEDDVNFARILLDTGRRQGFKGLIALQGDTALAMAREYLPHAITLDLQLPLLDGWTVLDHLKRDPLTRHIPVQVISVMDRDRGATVRAISYLEKPVSKEAIEGALAHMKSFAEREVKELLVVEDDEVQRQSIIELIGDMDVRVTAVGTGEDALIQLRTKPFDCMVLDLGLPDMAGIDLLKRIKKQARFKDLPVIIYTGQDLSKQEESQLKRYAATVITKDATSADRLLDETALFLHRVYRGTSNPIPGHNGIHAASGVAPSVPQLPEVSTEAAEGNPQTGRVLIVDDDVRNIFALTSALENHGMVVYYAENGREGIETLRATPGINLVLMDVMMPEMDGYETIRTIRSFDKYNDLPIIALTAKAMAGDRDKCIEAGASDYITKPVDMEQLLEMLRLHKPDLEIK
jgi:CheY-like chemotaxis protein